MRMFVSTRDGHPVGLAEAVFHGLASDGGLYVPTEIRALAEPPPAGLGFQTCAARVAPVLVPELPAAVVEAVATRALTFPVPLVEVEPGIHVLELFHGPTHAFKDVGARFLAALAAELDPDGPSRTVLVATSGDTGGAVAAAFEGLARFRVVVLFPVEGVSVRQRRQMTTLRGNVSALGVRGSFDDCQRMAKEAFCDERLAERHALMSANSINVGRLLPQTLYYVHAAALLGWADRPARFVVPCGNLGNLCSGLIAKRMGMPCTGFLAATNENRLFVDVLAGADPRPRRVVETSSTAMDVGWPSNLERIEWLYRGDERGLRTDVTAVSIDDASARRRIAEVYARTGYTLDPHSAVAYEAAWRHHSVQEGPTVVLATAHPAKFPEVVEAAVGGPIAMPEALARTTGAEEHMMEIPATLAALEAVLDGGRT